MKFLFCKRRRKRRRWKTPGRLALLTRGMTTEQAAYYASKEFLKSREWAAVRYEAFKQSDGKCQLCGRGKHQLEEWEILNADHIKPRRTHPWLALDLGNIQILCSTDNMGKGNRDDTDWRG